MIQMAYRAVLLLAIGVTAALLLAGAVIAWAVGLYLALADTVGPALALLLASGVPLLVGISALIAVPLLMQPPSSRRPYADSEEFLGELGNLAGSKLHSLIGAKPRQAAMASLLAGFAAGASPDLRRALLKLLKP
jgi:hypothetical protein